MRNEEGNVDNNKQEGASGSPWPFGDIIDLSVAMSARLPVSWPGHHEFGHSPWRSFGAGDSYQTNYVTMDEHCGTHCDAPAHFIRPEEYEGDCYHGDALPLGSLHGPLVVIDVRHVCSQQADGISPEIGIGEIDRWEQEHRLIGAPDVVVFRTGWDDFLADPKAYHRYVDGPVAAKDAPGWPVPSIATVDHLVRKGIRCFGIDAPSMGASQGGLALHRHALAQNLLFVEGLANLGKVPASGWHFMFLPLRLERSTGCPGRAIALGVQAS